VNKAKPAYGMVLLDTATFALAIVGAYLLRFQTSLFPPPTQRIRLEEYLVLLALTLPLLYLFVGAAGLYRAKLREPFLTQFGSLIGALAYTLLGLITISFFLRGLPESRLTLLLIGLGAVVLVPGARYLVYRVRPPQVGVALVGREEERRLVRERLELLRGSIWRVVGEAEESSQIGAGRIDAVVFCGTPSEDELARLEQVALDRRARLILLPASGLLVAGVLRHELVAGLSALSMASGEDLAALEAVRRVEDLVIGGLIFVLTLPLLLLGMLMVRLSSPGPIFYFHQRVGKGGRTIRLIKLRTMYVGAELPPELREEFARSYKLSRDPRVTPLGRILRKTSLDELPQLINVLRGDISLVGPRAIVREELEKYGVWGKLLTSVRPGLTGLWQVSGRSELTYPERVQLDIYYIQNWSLWLDLSIILRTPLALIAGRGAV